MVCSLTDRLYNFFSCRRDNPAVVALARKFPNIDAQSLVLPYIKKNLDDQELRTLRDRLRDESDLRDEIGQEAYDAYLDEIYLYKNLTSFSENADLFSRYANKKIHDRAVDFIPLSPKQRVVSLYRKQNQERFWDTVPQRPELRPHTFGRVQEVTRRCFPRLGEGVVPVREEDWQDISQVARNFEQAPARPNERLFFEEYLNQWRTVDFLEREREVAHHIGHPQTLAALNGDIEERKGQLRRGPIYPQALAAARDEDLSKPAYDDYQVCCLGNVLIDEARGKYAIIDWSGVPSLDRAPIQNKLSRAHLEEWLSNIDPGVPVYFDLVQNQLVPGSGRCHVYYELAPQVRKIAEDLDFNVGSRLVQKGFFDLLHCAKKEIARGSYKRSPKDYGEVLRRDPSTAQKRTAEVDRLEAILTVDNLRREILAGRSEQVDWNANLRLSDYFDAVRTSDLIRSAFGYAENGEFLQAISQFNEISASLERMIKGRVLLRFLEEAHRDQDNGEARRKYDLAEGVKLAAEASRVFRDWIQAMETLSGIMNEEGIRLDFVWFNEELQRILPAFRAFAATLPAELAEIAPLMPSQIEARYEPGALEDIISRTLACLNGPFYRLFPTYIYRLQIAQKGETFEKASSALMKKHQARPDLTRAFQLALPNAFQVPVRMENLVSGLAKALSRPSPLRPRILSAFQHVKQKALEAEKLRVTGARQLLDGHSKAAALRKFYPTVSL